MVEGVTDGFERRLEIQGVGYRAQLKGKALEMALGYSHPVSMPAPEGIEFEVPQPTEIVVRGIDKQLVGETAARIRKSRPPEPYKGKGDPLRGRARHPQGREAGVMSPSRPSPSSGCAGAGACAPGSAAAPSAPASPSTAPTAASSPS